MQVVPFQKLSPHWLLFELYCNIAGNHLSNLLLSNRIENNFSDQQLVSKVLHGDRHAFSVIIKNTETLVAQIVFKMVNNAEDRKDMAQDIYLKVFKNLAGFKFQSKLSTWIAQITYNTCLNYLEKKKLVLVDVLKHEHKDEAESLDFIRQKQMQVTTTAAETGIAQKQLSKILADEIDNLSPLYKTLVTLYHHEEMSYEEISSVTQLPEGTVKSYLYRARKSLKESILNKYKKEEL